MEATLVKLLLITLLSASFFKNGLACSDSECGSEAELIEWVSDGIDWRNSLAEWKRLVEDECESVSDENWKILFQCPDLSSIRCVNESARSTMTDALNCVFVYCSDGRYQDHTVLRTTWRQWFQAYKDIMKVYNNVLRYCPSRECVDTTTTTEQVQSTTDGESSVPIDQTQQPPPTWTCPTEGSCIPDNVGGCYWTKVGDCNYTEAQAYCQSCGAEVAIIPSQEIYFAIVQDVRVNMPESMPWSMVWVGMTINITVTGGAVNPDNAFYSWDAGSPSLSLQHSMQSNIVIHLEQGTNTVFGMRNTYAAYYYRTSVACYKPPVEVTTQAASATTVTTVPTRIPTTDGGPDTTTDDGSSLGRIGATQEPPPTWTCPTEGSCIPDNVGGCYWTKVGDCNYTEAQAYCQSCGAEVAIIPSQEIYFAIVQDVRVNMPDSMPWSMVWVGMTINVNVTGGAVNPDNAFYSWDAGSPSLSLQHSMQTNIVIHLEQGTNTVFGMRNTYAAYYYRTSVACYKPPVEVTTQAASATTVTTVPTRIPTTDGGPDTTTDDGSSLGRNGATQEPPPTSTCPTEGSCIPDNVGGCYWTKVGDCNYTEAQAYCQSCGAEVAIIPSQEIYFAIVQDVRVNMPDSMPWSLVWVGMTINVTVTGDAVSPANAFYPWETGWPVVGSQHAFESNIVIHLEQGTNTAFGMRNTYAAYYYRTSVVCYKSPVEVTTQA